MRETDTLMRSSCSAAGLFFLLQLSSLEVTVQYIYRYTCKNILRIYSWYPHPTLQNMNFSKKSLLLWVIFALLDLDPDSESGFGTTDPIESGSNPATDTDSDPIRIRYPGFFIRFLFFLFPFPNHIVFSGRNPSGTECKWSQRCRECLLWLACRKPLPLTRAVNSNNSSILAKNLAWTHRFGSTRGKVSRWGNFCCVDFHDFFSGLGVFLSSLIGKWLNSFPFYDCLFCFIDALKIIAEWLFSFWDLIVCVTQRHCVFCWWNFRQQAFKKRYPYLSPCLT